MLGNTYRLILEDRSRSLQNIFSGWNHRGVYILSRNKTLKTKIKRKLSPGAHHRLRMDYHRFEQKRFYFWNWNIFNCFSDQWIQQFANPQHITMWLDWDFIHIEKFYLVHTELLSIRTWVENIAETSNCWTDDFTKISLQLCITCSIWTFFMGHLVYFWIFIWTHCPE